VGVLGELVSVGDSGEHAEASDDGLHLENWGFVLVGCFLRLLQICL
jgi:hypothetical protein